MTYKTLIKVVALLFVSCSLSAVGQQTNQPPPQPAQQIRLIDYAGDLRAFLSQMPHSYDITVGLEVDPAQPHSYVTLKLDYPTVDDVFAAVVKSRPTYAWQRTNRLVDVYPVNSPTPLLETTVSKFQVNQVSRLQAVNHLFNQPEVKMALTRLGLTFTPTTSHTDAGGTNVSIDNNGLSIRQLLHNIARQSGSGLWVFRRSVPRHELFTIEMTPR